jgi:hypothetical protein
LVSDYRFHLSVKKIQTLTDSYFFFLGFTSPTNSFFSFRLKRRNKLSFKIQCPFIQCPNIKEGQGGREKEGARAIPEADPFLPQGADAVHSQEISGQVQTSQDKEDSNDKTGNIQPGKSGPVPAAVAIPISQKENKGRIA